MAFENLCPGIDVRWEDGRPFEVAMSPALAVDPETPERIRFLLRARGWNVVIGQAYSDGSQGFADVRMCEPVIGLPGGGQ